MVPFYQWHRLERRGHLLSESQAKMLKFGKVPQTRGVKTCLAAADSDCGSAWGTTAGLSAQLTVAEHLTTYNTVWSVKRRAQHYPQPVETAGHHGKGKQRSLKPEKTNLLPWTEHEFRVKRYLRYAPCLASHWLNEPKYHLRHLWIPGSLWSWWLDKMQWDSGSGVW